LPLLDRNGWKTEDYSRSESGSAIIVTLDALEGALAARSAGQRIGVEIPNTFKPQDLLAVQDQLALVAVLFPRFGDGRGFSLGQMLREQGYGGTLRVTGPIIPDQLAFAIQCGFDEVEISEEQALRQPIEQWVHAPELISASYQDRPGGGTSIFKRRQAEELLS
jgi:uncharacterized protein (DUF934 family)